MLGVFWIGLALAHAVLLRELPHGDGIVVDVLVGTFVGDTGAYLGGRTFGRRPLAPRISPNKTVEGLVIGIVVGAIAVWFAGLYQDWLLGRARSAARPRRRDRGADRRPLRVAASSATRGIKDTGRLFGAHGGALDRLDAVLFTAGRRLLRVAGDPRRSAEARRQNRWA